MTATYCVKEIVPSNEKPILFWFVLFILILFVPLANASNQTFTFDIPQQSADGALTALANQADISVVFDFGVISQHTTNRLKGRYVLHKAVVLLLAGTSLKFEFDGRGYLIVNDSNESGGEMSDMNLTSKKKMYAALVGLLVGSGGTQVSLAEDVGGHESSAMNEIIVTAGKREKSLQDTAMSISALDGDNIDKRGLVGMEDYLRSLPSVSMIDRGASQNTITIRGLVTNPQSAEVTTGVYFGEVPVSALGMTGASSGEPGNADLKLVDIERIEVLRGPQGTLYGSGSLGGTVRTIPNSPNLEEMEGSVGLRYSNTSELGGDNTMVQAVLNVPLIEDTLAVRGVAYQFDNSGFYENVIASQPSTSGLVDHADTLAQGGVLQNRGDVGADEYTGFRLSALWQPIESLDTTLSYVQQDIEQDGLPQANTLLEGDFQQRRVNTGVHGGGSEFFNTDIEIINLVVNYDLGWGAVTSSSSWLEQKPASNKELVRLSTNIGLPSSSPIYQETAAVTDVFTQEIRLVSQWEGPLEFIGGLFYEDREREGSSKVLYSATSTIAGPTPFVISTEQGIVQKAVFGEVSYDITEQLTTTVGARHYDYDRDNAGITTLPAFDIFNRESKEDTNQEGQTYRVNLTYAFNDDFMIYGQWSDGFRLGRGVGVTSTDCAALNLEANDIESDTSDNYELGFKSSLADSRITLNGAIYRIKWDGIPVLLRQGDCFQTQNAAGAESEGIELELEARVTEHFVLNVSTSYGESVLETEISNAFGVVVGASGDNLPGSSDFNFSLGADYLFTLGEYDSFIRYDYTYVSEYHNNFARDGIAAGGFGQSNVKVGTSVNQVGVELFVNNLTNEDDITWSDSIATSDLIEQGGRVHRLRPRTIGLNVNYQF